MKPLLTVLCLTPMLALAACGDDEKTTVIHEKPVIVQPQASGMSPADVEQACPNGYNNHTRQCY